MLEKIETTEDLKTMETKEKYYKCISKYNTKNRKSKKIIF